MPKCPVCAVIVAPLQSGRVIVHEPYRRRVMDASKPRCPGSGQAPAKASGRDDHQRTGDRP